MDKTHPAAHPPHGAGKFDGVATHLVRRRLQAPCALGRHHNRFQPVERARQPRRQTIGQQAEGRVALGAIPASDAHTLRRLALIRPVPCQRAAAVRMLRALLKNCLAPCLGGNVLLAGEPRLEAKLHRPWPDGGSLPAGLFLVQREAETTAAPPAPPSGEAVDASCGPVGVLRTVWTARGQAGACPPPDHTRRSRAHRSTASTAVGMMLRMKRSAAARPLPTFGHHPGKSNSRSM